jgi:hypothetical protein
MMEMLTYFFQDMEERQPTSYDTFSRFTSTGMTF